MRDQAVAHPIDLHVVDPTTNPRLQTMENTLPSGDAASVRDELRHPLLQHRQQHRPQRQNHIVEYPLIELRGQLLLRLAPVPPDLELPELVRQRLGRGWSFEEPPWTGFDYESRAGAKAQQPLRSQRGPDRCVRPRRVPR